METKMQRVKNAIKLIFLLLPLLIFSQNKIQGKYLVDHKIKDFGTIYQYFEDSTFEFKHFGDTGLLEYGRGHYYIKKDILTLSFDLTELNKDSYFKTKKYYNSRDSIEIKLKIYDFENKPLNKIMVYSDPEFKSTDSDKDGFATLKFKKKNSKDKIRLYIDGEFWDRQIIYLDSNANYDIDAFMSKSIIQGFEHPKAIKNVIVKYKILDLSKEKIKLKKGKSSD